MTGTKPVKPTEEHIELARKAMQISKETMAAHHTVKTSVVRVASWMAGIEIRAKETEKERCAKIADEAAEEWQWWDDTTENTWGVAAVYASGEIAARIRKEPKE